MNRRPKGMPRSNGRRVPPVGMHRAFEPADYEAEEAEQESQWHRRKTLSFEVPLPPKIEVPPKTTAAITAPGPMTHTAT